MPLSVPRTNIGGVTIHQDCDGLEVVLGKLL